MDTNCFQNAVFVRSCGNSSKFLFDKPQVCFIGRSNVGKSTLINSLVRRKQLMLTSKTAGRTYMVNYALIDNRFYLCDCPGYGYAKEFSRMTFAPMMEEYLEKNPMLKKVYILIDSRRLLFPADKEFSKYLDSLGVLYSYVFTKVDKLKKTEKDSLHELIHSLDRTCFETSLKGKDEIDKIRADILKSVR